MFAIIMYLMFFITLTLVGYFLGMKFDTSELHIYDFVTWALVTYLVLNVDLKREER